MLGRARLLNEAGYCVVLMDMQAHGESSGDMITFGFLEGHDVRAAVDYAKWMEPTHRIGIVAWSLGGAATLLHSPLGIDAAVLEAVYSSLEEAVSNRVAMRFGLLAHILTPALLFQLPLRLDLSASDLRPIDHIRELGCPVLIAVGELDQHTTLAETERLFGAALLPKQLVVFEGAEHVDLLEHDAEKYSNAVLPFLDTHLRAPADDD